MKNVEDLYPLSPMQEVMLLHGLRGAEDDVLFNQLCYELRGPLDADVFAHAWQRVVDRHSALRSLFVTEEARQPLQVVRRKVELAVEILDWRSLSDADQTLRREAYCADDRRKGFNTAKAPLTRLSLLQLDSDRYFLVWSCHHLVLDRWCLGTIFQDLFEFYSSALESRPPQLDPAVGFREYIAWIQRQDPTRAESFWRDQLRGLDAQTGICVDATRMTQEADDRLDASIEIDGVELDRLIGFARRNGITLSTVVQTAWALLLNRHNGHQDVVFGNAVSGRPPDLAGVEQIVGSFVNNVPMRVSMSRDDTLAEVLKRVQASHQARIPFEYVSLAEIHRWCEPATEANLFDSLLVWLSSAVTPACAGIDMIGHNRDLGTAYPFTLSVAEEPGRMTLHGQRSPRHATLAPIPKLLAQMAATLATISHCDPSTRLDEIDGFRIDARYRVPIAATTTDPWRTSAGVPTAPTNVTGTAGRELADREMLQDLVLSEWRQILGMDRIDPQRNFFELGGDSLHAARLHARIESATRKRIPLLSMFRQPTVQRMTEMLLREDWPINPQLATPVRAQGTGSPLFCVASPEVNTIGYAILGQYLNSPRRPVYVLQSLPTDANVRRLSPTELPILAKRYVEAMRGVQPTGPYHILGMCTGAHLALDMAHQLVDDGQPVAFLGVINTQAFYTVSRLYFLNRVFGRARWYRQRLGDLLRLDPAQRWAALRLILRRKLGADSAAAADASTTEDPARPTRAPEAAREDDSWLDRARPGHRPPSAPRFGGTITVFRTRRQQWWRVRDPALGWGAEAARVNVVRLGNGEHDAILREPDVGIIAARLNECLGGDRQAAPAIGGESIA